MLMLSTICSGPFDRCLTITRAGILINWFDKPNRNFILEVSGQDILHLYVHFVQVNNVIEFNLTFHLTTIFDSDGTRNEIRNHRQVLIYCAILSASMDLFHLKEILYLIRVSLRNSS